MSRCCPAAASAPGTSARAVASAPFTKGVTRTRRLRIVVTVKDSRGYLVRGATIKIRSKAAGRLTQREQTKPTGKTGQAAFVVRVKPQTLGKRLVMVAVARTPTAKTAKSTSVRLAKRR